ncbi:MAG: hypothetical protein AB1505_22210, partial [Candidatus Latescibacterota bacterium]
QPRERHYVFGGMYLSFALWMGLGWTGLVEWARGRLRLAGGMLAGVGLLGLVLPAGIFGRLYEVEDRTGDYVAYDYAYNLLQSCDPGSILYTNGDNDTFPLWYLQEVEGARKDVRVVNLSLLNTNWYIKQLRDREPRLPIRLDDVQIDSVLTDTELVDLKRRLWLEPKVPQELKKAGIDVVVKAPPGHDLLRVQDVMVIGLVYWNEWRLPTHFAITIPASNRVNLDPYLRMEGMTMQLVRERDVGPDPEKLAHNLYNVYQLRGITDPTVYKDENTVRLLGNYRACVLTLAEEYGKRHQGEEMVRLMRWAETRIPMGWEGFYSAANFLESVGQLPLAGEYVERATQLLIDIYGEEPVASYDNIINLAGVLVNPPYAQHERAEGLYRQVIALEPKRWQAYYELAASLQARDQVPAALALLQDYRQRHGEIPELARAEEVLDNAQRRAAQQQDTSVPPPEQP